MNPLTRHKHYYWQCQFSGISVFYLVIWQLWIRHQFLKPLSVLFNQYIRCTYTRKNQSNKKVLAYYWHRTSNSFYDVLKSEYGTFCGIFLISVLIFIYPILWAALQSSIKYLPMRKPLPRTIRKKVNSTKFFMMPVCTQWRGLLEWDDCFISRFVVFYVQHHRTLCLVLLILTCHRYFVVVHHMCSCGISIHVDHYWYLSEIFS